MKKMYQMLLGTIALLICLLCPTDIALTHSGGTDKYGCHRDSKTGVYHCHNSANMVSGLSEFLELITTTSWWKGIGIGFSFSQAPQTETASWVINVIDDYHDQYHFTFSNNIASTPYLMMIQLNTPGPIYVFWSHALALPLSDTYYTGYQIGLGTTIAVSDTSFFLPKISFGIFNYRLGTDTVVPAQPGDPGIVHNGRRIDSGTQISAITSYRFLESSIDYTYKLSDIFSINLNGGYRFYASPTLTLKSIDASKKHITLDPIYTYIVSEDKLPYLDNGFYISIGMCVRI